MGQIRSPQLEDWMAEAICSVLGDRTLGIAWAWAFEGVHAVSIVDEMPPSTFWICCCVEALAAEFHWSDTFQGRAPLAEACKVDSARASLLS